MSVSELITIVELDISRLALVEKKKRSLSLASSKASSIIIANFNRRAPM